MLQHQLSEENNMAISAGESLPDATVLKIGADGPESLTLSSLTKGRKVVIFGLPGAYTRTCTAAHVPSFCLLYTSPSPRDRQKSRMPSSA